LNHIVDQGHVVAFVSLDLRSVFDTMDHSTLLVLLQDRYSVSDQSLAWFQSYLTSRTQTFTTASTQAAPVFRDVFDDSTFEAKASTFLDQGQFCEDPYLGTLMGSMSMFSKHVDTN